MISFVMPARNAQQCTARALISLQRAVMQLGWRERAHVLLIDDASEPALGIATTYQNFREQSGLPTRILQFKQQQHYCGVFSAGMSFAIGEKIFLLSNDMIFTADFLRTLVDVSNLHPSICIVRGTSNHTDSHPEHIVIPPFPLRTIDDVLSFSQYVSSYWKQHFVEDSLLSGDAILINRTLIDRIGVIDTRFFGYFGDVDYGLRAIRAGFKLVCAKGAWLFHEGAGHVKDDAVRSNTHMSEQHAKRMQLVQQAYERFREKWDMNLPTQYSNVTSLAFAHLHAPDALRPDHPVPPFELHADIGKWI